MKTVTIRDFRSRPKSVQSSLSSGQEALLTSNGKPVALMIPVDIDTIDETLELLQRARAQQALRAIRKSAKESGANRLGYGAVEQAIKESRKSRSPKR